MVFKVICYKYIKGGRKLHINEEDMGKCKEKENPNHFSYIGFLWSSDSKNESHNFFKDLTYLRNRETNRSQREKERKKRTPRKREPA